MLLFLKLALMLCLALRLRFGKGLLTCSGALLAGFATGTFRVCILAVLVNRPWFNTLHGPAGTNLFPLIGFLLFAPFLLHAEEPFENLLRQALRAYRCEPPLPSSRAPVLALIATGYCLCLIAGDRLQPRRYFIPLAQSCATQGLSQESGDHVPVPETLLARRFNSVKEAHLWRIEKGGTTHTVLACAITNAQLGPKDLVEDPEFAGFLKTILTDSTDLNAIGLDRKIENSKQPPNSTPPSAPRFSNPRPGRNGCKPPAPSKTAAITYSWEILDHSHQ